ncbi:hypothetical protein [Bradyrhizobium sp. RDM4]|uniref:hypothetical protein n=1 Tax=Bradyrhizobium sp. RDM4 TaxID=3378765 RepID=UPI0038FCEAFA
MSDAKYIAEQIVAEVKDSAHLFFTPVRAIVNEFTRAVHDSARAKPEPKGHPSNDTPKYGAGTG